MIAAWLKRVADKMRSGSSRDSFSQGSSQGGSRQGGSGKITLKDALKDALKHSPFIQLVSHDFYHATHNVIAAVVLTGMIILPALYAWFNIAGSWDPYGNTKNLKIAVANTDAGYKSNTLPLNLNMGDEVVGKLAQKTSIDYVITTSEDATSGVKDGRYYAALIIPPTFSKQLLTVFSVNAEPANITYLSNEKINAIAPLVTEKAADAVKTDITESFAQTVSAVAAQSLQNVQTFIESDQVSAVGARFATTTQTLAGDVRHIKNTLASYKELTQAAEKILDSSDSLAALVAEHTQGSKEALEHAHQGIQDAQSSSSALKVSLEDALSHSQSSLDALALSFDQVKDAVTSTAEDGSVELDALASKVRALRDGYQAVRDALKSLEDEAASDTVTSALEPLRARVQASVDELDALAERLDKARSTITVTQEDASTFAGEARALKEQLKGLSGDLSSALDSELSRTMELASAASGFGDSANEQLKTLENDLNQVSSNTHETLDNLQVTLDSNIDSLEKLAGRLEGLHDDLQAALDTSSTAELQRILSANADDLAQFMAAPVEVKREAIYPVANNGSAMAGFYTTLSLWVGAVVLVAMMSTQVDDLVFEDAAVRAQRPSARASRQPARASRQPARASRQSARASRQPGSVSRQPGSVSRYLGRLVIFLVLGIAQALFVSLGDIFYLGIQVVDPLHFVLSCIWISLVFVNIMYALAASFGDVGKAIAVFLLVIQVAGGGGTFPVQMLTKPFQVAYPYLPFVHGISALHECIAGFYGKTWQHELLILGIYVAAALVLGLVLHKAVLRLNHWVAKQLEATKMM